MWLMAIAIQLLFKASETGAALAIQLMRVTLMAVSLIHQKLPEQSAQCKKARCEKPENGSSEYLYQRSGRFHALEVGLSGFWKDGFG